MWQCMSTPPGMTTSPLASIMRAGLTSGSVGGSTICRPSIQMSRTAPSIPLAGAETLPPAILKYSLLMKSDASWTKLFTDLVLAGGDRDHRGFDAARQGHGNLLAVDENLGIL